MDSWELLVWVEDCWLENSWGSSSSSINQVTSLTAAGLPGQVRTFSPKDNSIAAITANAALQLLPDTFIVSSNVDIAANAAWTQPSDAVASSSTVSIAADLSLSLLPDVHASSSTVEVNANASYSSEGDLVSATATVGSSEITANVNTSLQPDVHVASANTDVTSSVITTFPAGAHATEASVNVAGNVSFVTNGDSVSAEALVLSPIEAQVTITLAGDAVAAQAFVSDLPILEAEAVFTSTVDSVSAVATVAGMPSNRQFIRFRMSPTHGVLLRVQ